MQTENLHPPVKKFSNVAVEEFSLNPWISFDIISKYSRGIEPIKNEYEYMEYTLSYRNGLLYYKTKDSSEIKTEEVISKQYYINHGTNPILAESILHFATHPELNEKEGMPEFFTCCTTSTYLILFFKRNNLKFYTARFIFPNETNNEDSKKCIFQLFQAVSRICNFKKKQDSIRQLPSQNLNSQDALDVQFQFCFKSIRPSNLKCDQTILQYFYFPDLFYSNYTPQSIRTCYDSPEIIQDVSKISTIENLIYSFGAILCEIHTERLKQYTIPFLNEKLGVYSKLVEGCVKNEQERWSIDQITSFLESIY